MTEDALIARIAERLRGVTQAHVLVGIGDDAAVWQPARGNRSVMTTDALVEGVHFTREAMSARDAGHRALASNLSDVAAMGARPVLATVALGVPPGTDPDWILGCYDGIAALAARTRCAVVGGDLTRAPAIFLSITVVGEVRASNLKLRRGARPGDVLALTGPLGASRAGLWLATNGGFTSRTAPTRIRAGAAPASGGTAASPGETTALATYRTPEPRLREGKFLGASRNVRAMMDTSDGLSTDLARLCAASGTGAVLDDVPVHPAARRVAERAGEDPIRWALDGGEDFELLVAVEKRAYAHLAARLAAHTGRPLVRIGTVSAEPGVRLADGTTVAAAGWDHLRSEGSRKTGAPEASLSIGLGAAGSGEPETA